MDVGGSVEALRAMIDGKLAADQRDALCTWYNDWKAVLPFGHGIFAGAVDYQGVVELWEATGVRMLQNALGEIDERFKAAAEAFPCKNASQFN